MINKIVGFYPKAATMSKYFAKYEEYINNINQYGSFFKENTTETSKETHKNGVEITRLIKENKFSIEKSPYNER